MRKDIVVIVHRHDCGRHRRGKIPRSPSRQMSDSALLSCSGASPHNMQRKTDQ